MLKLIKMDMHRLFTSKTTAIGAFASVIMSIVYVLGSLGIIALSKLAFKDDPEMAIGLGEFFSQVSWMNGVNFATIALEGTMALSLFVGCAVSASFIGSEQACGYTKNYAGLLSDKGYTVISKFVVTSVAQIMVLLIYTVVSGAFGRVVLGQYITGYDWLGLLGALGLRILLHLAINAIIVFLCTLTKSHSIAMVAASIFGLGITRFAYLSVSMALGVAKIEIDISKYLPDGINSQLNIYTAGNLAVKAIVVSVICIAVFIAANYVVVRKRDVR